MKRMLFSRTRGRRLGTIVAGGAVGCGLLVSDWVSGEEWTQYRGPNHDGVSGEKISKEWPPAGPEQVWKVPLTAGFSSCVVAGGRLFTQIVRDVEGEPTEFCVALDADSGRELWAVPVGLADYDSGAATAGEDTADGPRSTPAVEGGRVYVIGSQLNLFCLAAADGAEQWKVDFVSEYGGREISWQNAASPLIEDGRVFLNCNAASGGRLMALDTMTGAEVWRSAGGTLTHASPVLATIHERRQLIFLTKPDIVAVDPATGGELWRFSFTSATAMGASPVVAGDIVYCSAGYGKGALAIRVDFDGEAFSVSRLWPASGLSTSLMNHWSTPVHHEGYLYGLFSYGSYGTAPLKCVDLATGEEMWSERGFGQSGLIYVDGHLLVLSEAGELVLVEANSTRYVEVHRFEAIAGKCWNAPALCDGRIYARSTDEAICLNVAVERPPLRLEGVAALSDGAFRLRVGGLDGADLPAERLEGTRVLATTDPSLDPSQWQVLGLSVVYTNGGFDLLDLEAPQHPERYYLLRDEL